jgi:class 3 adenylate cyclase/pimeloyl-ACP methyl ester carboxylesterase
MGRAFEHLRAASGAIGQTVVAMIDIPETKYTTLGDERIAYQVFGKGETDLLLVGSSGDGIDARWYWPPYASFLHQLGNKARVITFDLRGTGASDVPSGEALPPWERWADDARAVMDAVPSERAVVLGSLDGGSTAVLFAASHPARSRGLVLFNTMANYESAPPEATSFVREAWGTDAMAEFGTPDAARDPLFRRWVSMTQRQWLPPSKASRHFELVRSIDLRDALHSVRVPTLVIQRQGHKPATVEEGQNLAARVPGARFVVVPGNDAMIFCEPASEILDHIEAFLKELQPVKEPDRALAAILFTDIVGSTERASALGDKQWRHLLQTHDAVARTVVEQHGGQVVKSTGDGMLATFDGPGRAIRCAVALGDSLRPLGLEIKAGLHTGEVELMGGDIAGIGVHIAARVLESAAPGEVWVSAAVPMLVAGSGIAFEDRGTHSLKGVADEWRLYAVTG